MNNPLRVRELSWAPNILDNLHEGPDTFGLYDFDGLGVPRAPEGMHTIPQHGEHSRQQRRTWRTSRHRQPESYNAVGMDYETAVRSLNSDAVNPLGEDYSDQFAGDEIDNNVFGGWHFQTMDGEWERGMSDYRYGTTESDWYDLPSKRQLSRLPMNRRKKRRRNTFGLSDDTSPTRPGLFLLDWFQTPFIL